jgi:hypothetical protein
VSKRTALVLAAAAGLCGLAASGLIGFIGHAPGRAATWADVRAWLTFAAVVVGVPAALYQLSLQRRQLASQQSVIEGEVERNKRRDELRDGQLRELQQRAELLERQQADQIKLRWAGSVDSTYMAIVTNESSRPIRNLACQIAAPGREPQLAIRRGPFVPSGFEPGKHFPLVSEGSCASLIRVAESYGFVFALEYGHPDARISARFTDDGGLHWQIDHDLHLEKLSSRDDW